MAAPPALVAAAPVTAAPIAATPDKAETKGELEESDKDMGFWFC